MTLPATDVINQLLIYCCHKGQTDRQTVRLSVCKLDLILGCRLRMQFDG